MSEAAAEACGCSSDDMVLAMFVAGLERLWRGGRCCCVVYK